MTTPEGGAAGVVDWQAVGTRLKRAREAAGLTQEQAAKRAGVHWTSLSRWENGKPMRVGDLRQIAAAYEADVDRLLYGEPRPVAPALNPSELKPGYWEGRLAEIADQFEAATARLRAFQAAAGRWEAGTVLAQLHAAHAATTPNASPALTGDALADLTDDELAPMLRAPSPSPRTVPDPPPPAAPRGASPGGAAPRPRHRRKA
jgi:transcriptional regulator with XRE-family HTH domain